MRTRRLSPSCFHRSSVQALYKFCDVIFIHLLSVCINYLHCRMDFFGLTIYGYADPIKQMMRGDYVEPRYDHKVPPPERMRDWRVLDVFTAEVDGFARGSNDLLHRMRRKGVYKPVGPLDMYKTPGCGSMDPGWWMADPLLKGKSWYKPHKRHPLVLSEASRFVNAVGALNAY